MNDRIELADKIRDLADFIESGGQDDVSVISNDFYNGTHILCDVVWNHKKRKYEIICKDK